MKDTRALPEWTAWAKPLVAGGSKVAALVINTRQDRPATVTVALSALGLPSSSRGTPTTEMDVWSGKVRKLVGDHWKVALPAGGHRWVIMEA